MDQSFIQLNSISKAFTGNRVLHGVDLMINRGEVLCIAGENGSGKSTLIKIISGVYTYDDGELLIDDKHFPVITPEQSIEKGIQVIYQDFSIFPNLTVAENIGLSLSVHEKKKWVNWSQWREAAAQALAQIGVDIDLDAEVGLLPVAQKQIIAISRAVVQDARLIIMDEPTTALTQREIDRLFDIIRNLKDRGISVIFVSHKLDELFAISDRIAVLRNGYKVVDQTIEEFQRDKLVYYMTGEEVAASELSPYEDTGLEPVIEVKGATRKEAFYDVSFSVRAGEILAITGQLGSGRTELACSLFGINPIQKGQILIDGIETRIKNRFDARKHGIAYLPEDRLSEGLYLSRSLGENFASVIIDTLKGNFKIVNSDRLKKISDFWIDKLGMTPKHHTEPASVFSGGNQQRIVLGKWLASEPKIFILNGPTVGVDVKSKSEIHEIIKDLAKQGLAVIMISDDIGEVLSTSNRVIVMRDQKVTFQGNTSDLTEQSLGEKILAVS